MARPEKSSGIASGRKAFRIRSILKLAQAEAVGHAWLRVVGLRLQRRLKTFAAPPHRGERIVADVTARHSRRHSGAHDGADGGAGNGHRANAELVQNLDHMQMRQPARPAAAEGHRHGRPGWRGEDGMRWEARSPQETCRTEGSGRPWRALAPVMSFGPAPRPQRAAKRTRTSVAASDDGRMWPKRGGADYPSKR